MASAQIFVREMLLDDKWAACARQILLTGTREGGFSVSIMPGSDRAFFAFEHEGDDADDAIGVLLYVVFQRNDYHRTFRLNLLSVLPGHRRRGASKAMLNAAYNLAIERGCTELDVLVNSFNAPMLRMLERNGFGYEVVQLRRTVEENRRDDDLDF